MSGDKCHFRYVEAEGKPSKKSKKGGAKGSVCAPHERSLCAPKFGERSHEETLHQEGHAHKAALDLAKHFHKLKNSDKATFYTPVEVKAMSAPTSERPEEHQCT